MKQEALASSRHWLGERNGPEQHRAASAVPKARHSPQRHPWARIRNRETPARFTPTGLPLGRQSPCRLAPSNPLKAKVDGWSRGLGERNGPEQHRAASAVPKARHSPQRHPWARIRNRETPARFTPAGLPLGRQSRCRLAPSHRLKAKVDGWSRKLWQAAGIGWADVTALSKTVRHSKGTSQPPASPVSTHPKQGNPSKIRAQRVATWLAEPLPFGTFEPPKSKGGRVKQGALASSRHWLGERNGPEQHRAASAVPKARHSPQRHPWARIRNRQTPARFTPTGLPLGRQPLPFGTFAPTKSKGGRLKQEALNLASGRQSKTVRHQPFQRHVTARSVTREHASETGKPQQDSRPPGCHLVGRAAAVWHLRAR